MSCAYANKYKKVWLTGERMFQITVAMIVFLVGCGLIVRYATSTPLSSEMLFNIGCSFLADVLIALIFYGMLDPDF